MERIEILHATVLPHHREARRGPVPPTGGNDGISMPPPHAVLEPPWLNGAVWVHLGEASWTHTGSRLNLPRELRSLQKLVVWVKSARVGGRNCLGQPTTLTCLCVGRPKIERHKDGFVQR